MEETAAMGCCLGGRNFDLTYSPALVVETAPDNGYRSISTVNLAFLGFGEDKLPDTWKQKLIALAAPYAPLDGINEKGLAVAVLRIADEPTDQDTGKTDITTTTAIRLMLDKAATVDEAVSLLEQYDMHSSAGSCYHFQLADAAGNSAVVEYIDNEFVVLKAGMDLLQAASKDWHVSETSGRLNATQWSIVFNCTDLTAKVVTGRQYDKPAHTFSLTQ